MEGILPVHAAASADGRFVAAPDNGGELHVVEADTGRRIPREPRPWDPNRPRDHFLAFCRGGGLLAVGGGTGFEVRRLSRANDGTSLLAPGWRVEGSFRWCAFTPDGADLLAATQHAVMRLDAASGAPRPAAPGHGGPVRFVAWLPGGKDALTCDTGAVRIWDAATGSLRNEALLERARAAGARS